MQRWKINVNKYSADSNNDQMNKNTSFKRSIEENVVCNGFAILSD
jgi:hypothetical protein